MSKYISKVALIGGTGRVGAVMLKHLLAAGHHKITVLTRVGSKASFPSGVTITEVDYGSSSSIISALRGHNFLTITLAATAPPELHSQICNAAAAAGVEWVMPNYYAFGLGARAQDFATHPLLGRPFANKIADVRNASTADHKLNSIALVCGFWYEFSLSSGPEWFGFNIAKRTVTFYDAGTTKINTSTWEQCGRATAALLALPIDQGSPKLQDWEHEGGAHIASFLISQRDMLDSLHRVLGTTDADWKIEYQASEERHNEGMAQMGAGDPRIGYVKAMYAKAFMPKAGGDYETGYGLDNEKLGLPKEDLDEATARAVEMVKQN